MRKIGAIMGIAALAALVSSHLPAGAFGIHLGRFYFHLPLAGHHNRHYPMRTNRNEARTRPNDLLAVAIAPPPAGAMPRSRMIARRVLKPIRRGSKVAPV